MKKIVFQLPFTCSKLTIEILVQEGNSVPILPIKIPERRPLTRKHYTVVNGRCSSVFTVNFETDFTPCCTVSVVDFEQFNVTEKTAYI